MGQTESNKVPCCLQIVAETSENKYTTLIFSTIAYFMFLLYNKSNIYYEDGGMHTNEMTTHLH